jgi:type IV pilus assembly protein PilC
MPRYTYLAKIKPNQTLRGDIDAESEQDAINKLNKKGYFLLSIQIEDLSLGKNSIFGLKKIPKKDVVQFTRQLSNLIGSGINIIDSLNIVSRQTNNKYIKAVIGDIVSKIKDGKTLSESLANHPVLFPELYSSMVRSGEASGNLNETLKRLLSLLEREEEFANSVRAALTYPFFVLAVGVATVLTLLLFVIPRLVGMFESMGEILPLPTRILIGISDFSRDYAWAVIAATFIFIFLLRRAYRSPQGRYSFDMVKLKLPIFGHIFLKTEIARLMRTLSLLLSGGMPILPSLGISASVVENRALRAEIIRLKEEVSGGSSLHQSLRSSKMFPEAVITIVSVGEETGSLDKSLVNIADDYEKEIERALKTLTRLLEPIIILVMSLIVGFIVMAMILPILELNLIVQ